MLGRCGMVAVALLALIGSATGGIGPDFLIRIDLNRGVDFDRAVALDLKPVYRWGNEFYFVADGAGLNQLNEVNLKYRVIDQDPFVSRYYYVEAKSPVAEGPGLTKYGAEAIDQIGGATLCRSDQPLSFVTRFGGDGPIPITGEKIPLVYTTPLTVAGALVDNPILDTIIARISMDSIVAYDTRLVDFRTRYAYADSNAAAEIYLRQKFLSFGYTDVTQDTFDVLGVSGIGHNIICTKAGTVEPEKVILIGAHFDSYTTSNPLVSAPGADDNASGTSGVLEIARALAQIPSRKTIVFVAFDAEEQWMIGSYYYAGRSASAGTDIELMLNMDMIGYDPDNTGALWINTYPTSLGYANLAARLAHAKTALQPWINPNSPASDQLPFAQRGWHFIWAEEGNFNTPGYHNDTDQLWRLNQPYWTDAVRMIAMTAYSVSEAPVPVKGVELCDVGDGRSLEVRWTPAGEQDITGYRVLRGPSSGSYVDSASAPATASSYRLGNLTEGQSIYVAVCAVNAAGWESVALTEKHLAPYYLPRTPANVFANVMRNRIELSWDAAIELDFDHYALYRGTDSMSLSVLIPSLTAASYVDLDVAARTRYFYRIVAVDRDANASAPSSLVSGIPATFDQGLLLADLTSHISVSPPETEQWEVYNSMFANYQHGYYRYDDYTVPLDKSMLGQFGTLYYLDDDYEWENWTADHWAKLNWYLANGTNMAVFGWATPSEVRSGGSLYDLAHVSAISRIDDFDCVGGIGVNGFPSVTFDTAKVLEDWSGTLLYIWTMTSADGPAATILRYNSATNNPTREAQTVGVRCNLGDTKVAFIGLPLYFIREHDAEALVTALNNWFGLPIQVMGDLSGDGIVDVLDVLVLIGTAFEGQTPPSGMASADVNGSCAVDVLDVIYMINHVFLNGPAPGPGCAPPAAAGPALPPAGLARESGKVSRK